MAKKIVVEYWGSSRDSEPMHLHTETYTQDEWEKEDKDAIQQEVQDAALYYFEVAGWYEVKEVEDEIS